MTKTQLFFVVTAAVFVGGLAAISIAGYVGGQYVSTQLATVQQSNPILHFLS